MTVLKIKEVSQVRLDNMKGPEMTIKTFRIFKIVFSSSEHRN